MNRPFGLPLAASIAGHCCLLLALLVFLGQVPIPPAPKQRRGIEVMLSPPEPPVAAPQPPPIPVMPPPVRPPPPPSPMVETTPPLPPAAHPARRVVVRPAPRRPPPVEREPVPEPRYVPSQPTFYAPPQSAALPPQPTPAPPRPAAPLVSARYQAELNAWLASHKDYPDSARERGEQGQVLLHFRVDRSGRVLSYSLAGSTGYPDLDTAVEKMMRGAVLPPFPPDMAANEIPVTVTVRFSLR